MTKSLVGRWAKEGKNTIEFFDDDEAENDNSQDEKRAEKHEHSDKK